ncbi:MAG: glycosyltransferase family 2 protein [Chloroflexi bacterium]|nr:glycosyltransferase family 2 protein [Ardenticatenaceae bacterium]NOG33895.1 glycosyltransferase family 2 protein [Chloroflexota bacterium]GIK54773.1 MAG: hypothetical protein BroJett015_04360 [Chloroflexota bacterium]
MSSQIETSIVIATYNRASYLAQCLEALARLEFDPKRFEVLIVDNNSNDDTPTVCMHFIQAHPELDIRYIFEKNQGASQARNRGVEEARGEIICFLDDDSPPFPHWLHTLLQALNDPSVGCAGGPSILDFQGQAIPRWLDGDLQSLLSSYALPYTEITQLTEWYQFPLSCNMAIRRRLFYELGFLRTDLSKIADQPLAAAETEMADRINKAGWKVVYVPHAPVYHLVPPERLNREYIYHRGRGLAKSHIILTDSRKPHIILRWFASDGWYAARRFFWLSLAIIERNEKWFDDYIRFWIIAQRIPLRFKRLFSGGRSLA